MSLANSIRSSTQWLLAGSLGSNMLNFLVGIVLARLLVPEDFGLLVTVQIFTGVAGLIAGGGMGQALVRSKDASERDFNVVFTLQFGICLLIYALFFIIAPYFAKWYDEPVYEGLLRVTALNFLIRPLVGSHSSWLQRNMRFKIQAIVNFTGGLITSISSVYMAWIGMGVWSLALSGIVGSLLSWLLLSVQTPLRIGLAFDKGATKRIGGTGAKFSVIDIVSYIRGQVNNFIIGRAVGPAAVGLFNKADSLAKLPFSTIGASVYQPVFRSLAAEQDDLDKSKYIYLRTITLLFVYTFPAYITFSMLAEPFIRFVYGPKWVEAAAPLSILAWVWVFSCIGQPSGALLTAQNKLGQELFIQFNTLVLNIIACIVGLNWGLTGVAWALLSTRLYTVSHNLWMVAHCIPLGFREILNALKPGAMLGGALLVALLLANFISPTDLQHTNAAAYLTISLSLGGVVYLTSLLYLPIPAIRSESDRLKKLLRLAPAQQDKK